MAKISDLETDVTLGKLASRAIKAREAAKHETVFINDGDFRVAVWWESKLLCIQIAHVGGSDAT